MLLILTAVLAKVGWMQTVGGETLRSQAAQQWTRTRILPAQRGAIFDRNGDELALSVPASTIAVNPKQVVDPVGTAAHFATVLGLDAERRSELEAAMTAKEVGFVYVARQVDTNLGDEIRALELPGVSVTREDRRTLPGGVTGRSVIGRTDIDGKGTAGVEKQYNSTLSGRPGEERIEIAPGGRSIAGTEEVTTPTQTGSDIVLTLDRSVQYAAEQSLLERAAATRARGGQVIVMETKTGNVIAMASVQISDEGIYEVTSANSAAVDAYEPGSVGKVITLAAALNEGTVTPETSFTVPWTQVFTKDGKRLSDSHQHPTESMTVRQILTESSNIGTIMVGQSLKRDGHPSVFQQQYEYLEDFGFGEPTALGFPDESTGILNPWQQWEGTEKYTVAYGQGLASTPIQLAAAVNAVANDGTYVEPRLLDATVDGDGELHETAAAESRRVVSEAAATQLQAMMKGVICDEGGTASRAAVDGLSVAGKTGTGYIAQPDGTYFLEDGVTRAYYASFVGFLPAEDPQVTILVSIDQPDAQSGDRFGGTAATPVFTELAPIMVHELGIEQPAGVTGCPE